MEPFIVNIALNASIITLLSYMLNLHLMCVSYLADQNQRKRRFFCRFLYVSNI